MFDRFGEIFFLHELEHGRAFAAGNDESVDIRQPASTTNLDRRHADARERPRVRREVALNSQHANLHILDFRFWILDSRFWFLNVGAMTCCLTLRRRANTPQSKI